MRSAGVEAQAKRAGEQLKPLATKSMVSTAKRLHWSPVHRIAILPRHALQVYTWDMHDYEVLQQTRPQFRGDEQVDVRFDAIRRFPVSSDTTWGSVSPTRR